jgi:hypothetical protein
VGCLLCVNHVWNCRLPWQLVTMLAGTGSGSYVLRRPSLNPLLHMIIESWPLCRYMVVGHHTSCFPNKFVFKHLKIYVLFFKVSLRRSVLRKTFFSPTYNLPVWRTTLYQLSATAYSVQTDEVSGQFRALHNEELSEFYRFEVLYYTCSAWMRELLWLRSYAIACRTSVCYNDCWSWSHALLTGFHRLRSHWTTDSDITSL